MCSCMWWPRPRFWKMLPMLDVIPLNNLAATEKEGRKTIFRIMNNSRFSFPHYSTLGAPVCDCCYMASIYTYVCMYTFYTKECCLNTTRLFRIWQFQDSSWCIIRECTLQNWEVYAWWNVPVMMLQNCPYFGLQKLKYYNCYLFCF